MDTSKKNEEIDVFISYRREGGAAVARLLYEVLKSRCITGFMDAESLGSGDYAEGIHDNISRARCVVLVMAPGTLESEWVKQEVFTALSMQKKIIPVFVNGVNCFPSDLPADISALSKANAITIDHDHFESNLQKLLSWLDTRHNQVIRSYIDALDGQDDASEIIFRTWKEIVGEKSALEVMTERLKYAWQGRTSATSVSGLVQDMGTWDLKCMMAKLGIENKGSRVDLLRRLDAWLINTEIPQITEDEDEDLERFYRLESACADVLKNKERRETIRGICDKYQICPSQRRSSADFVGAVFDSAQCNNIETIFNLLKIDEVEAKSISMHLFDNDKGRRSALVEYFEYWVSYTV